MKDDLKSLTGLRYFSFRRASRCMIPIPKVAKGNEGHCKICAETYVSDAFCYLLSQKGICREGNMNGADSAQKQR